jgi:hypothetical protein
MHVTVVCCYLLTYNMSGLSLAMQILRKRMIECRSIEAEKTYT